MKKAASCSFISKVKWVGWQAFVSSSSSEDARGGTAVLSWGECEHVSNATAVADNAHGRETQTASHVGSMCSGRAARSASGATRLGVCTSK